MKRTIVTIAVIVLVVVLAITLPNIMPGIGTYTQDKPAGFLSGVWHGWIAPVSLVFGIFNSDITIFESMNTGWWYGCGFYIAIVSGFGGITLFRRPKKLGAVEPDGKQPQTKPGETKERS